MKRFLSVILCGALAFCMIGCESNKANEHKPKNTASKQEISPLKVGIIEDSSMVFLTNFTDNSTEGKLKGKYTINTFSSAEKLGEAIKKGEAEIAFMPTVDAINLSEETGNIYKICKLCKFYNYELLCKENISFSDLEGKQVCAYTQNAAAIFSAILNEQNVSCEITTLTDKKQMQNAVDSGKYFAFIADYPFALQIENASSYKVRANLIEEWESKGITDFCPTASLIINNEISLTSKPALELFINEVNANLNTAESKDYICENLVALGIASSKENAEKCFDKTAFSFDKAETVPAFKDFINKIGTAFTGDTDYEKIIAE